jgi:hypothetical protein
LQEMLMDLLILLMILDIWLWLILNLMENLMNLNKEFPIFLMKWIFLWNSDRLEIKKFIRCLKLFEVYLINWKRIHLNFHLHLIHTKLFFLNKFKELNKILELVLMYFLMIFNVQVEFYKIILEILKNKQK